MHLTRRLAASLLLRSPMIDIGLTKIALIGAVALIVIGPEKLPAVARMAGTLFGRAQRYISNVKAEVNREMQMEELNKMHSNIVNAANNLHKTVADDIAEAEQDFTQAVAEANQSYLGGDGWKHAPSEQDLAEKSKQALNDSVKTFEGFASSDTYIKTLRDSIKINNKDNPFLQLFLDNVQSILVWHSNVSCF